MYQDSIMITVIILSALILYLIIKLAIKNGELNSMTYRYNKLATRSDTLSTHNKYLLSKVKGMREELDEIQNTEAEV